MMSESLQFPMNCQFCGNKTKFIIYKFNNHYFLRCGVCNRILMSVPEKVIEVITVEEKPP